MTKLLLIICIVAIFGGAADAVQSTKTGASVMHAVDIDAVHLRGLQHLQHRTGGGRIIKISTDEKFHGGMKSPEDEFVKQALIDAVKETNKGTDTSTVDKLSKISLGLQASADAQPRILAELTPLLKELKLTKDDTVFVNSHGTKSDMAYLMKAFVDAGTPAELKVVFLSCDQDEDKAVAKVPEARKHAKMYMTGTNYIVQADFEGKAYYVVPGNELKTGEPLFIKSTMAQYIYICSMACDMKTPPMKAPSQEVLDNFMMAKYANDGFNAIDLVEAYKWFKKEFRKSRAAKSGGSLVGGAGALMKTDPVWEQLSKDLPKLRQAQIKDTTTAHPLVQAKDAVVKAEKDAKNTAKAGAKLKEDGPTFDEWNDLLKKEDFRKPETQKTRTLYKVLVDKDVEKILTDNPIMKEVKEFGDKAASNKGTKVCVWFRTDYMIKIPQKPPMCFGAKIAKTLAATNDLIIFDKVPLLYAKDCKACIRQKDNWPYTPEGKIGEIFGGKSLHVKLLDDLFKNGVGFFKPKAKIKEDAGNIPSLHPKADTVLPLVKFANQFFYLPETKEAAAKHAHGVYPMFPFTVPSDAGKDTA